jgi:DeoR/GlpR family transcriptional regulator of sugar metabolism
MSFVVDFRWVQLICGGFVEIHGHSLEFYSSETLVFEVSFHKNSHQSHHLTKAAQTIFISPVSTANVCQPINNEISHPHRTSQNRQISHDSIFQGCYSKSSKKEVWHFSKIECHLISAFCRQELFKLLLHRVRR